jgi:hypothetical protein
MLKLAEAEVKPRTVQNQKNDQLERTDASREPAPDSPEEAFAAWLRQHGYREPDGLGDEVAGVCPDLIYRTGRRGVAVFFDDADRDAHEVLRDEGWSVILIGPNADWQQVVDRYPSVFGGREGAL